MLICLTLYRCTSHILCFIWVVVICPNSHQSSEYRPSKCSLIFVQLDQLWPAEYELIQI